MNKLWLIIKREYLTRVKKRSFILATILTPFAFVLFFIVVGFIFSYEGDDKLKVALVDEHGILDRKPANEDNLFFVIKDDGYDQLVSGMDSSEFDVVIKVPEVKILSAKTFEIEYHAKKQLGLDIEMNLESKISSKIRDYKMREMKLEKSQLDNLKSSVSLT